MVFALWIGCMGLLYYYFSVTGSENVLLYCQKSVPHSPCGSVNLRRSESLVASSPQTPSQVVVLEVFFHCSLYPVSKGINNAKPCGRDSRDICTVEDIHTRQLPGYFIISQPLRKLCPALLVFKSHTCPLRPKTQLCQWYQNQGINNRHNVNLHDIEEVDI